MPESDHFDGIDSDSTVDVIADTAKMDAPHAREVDVRCSSSEEGVASDELEASSKLLDKSIGGPMPIFQPPSARLSHLPRRTRRDEERAGTAQSFLSSSSRN